MKEAQDRPIVAFETAQALDAWLEEHGASSPGIYIKIAKKDSGILSVNYAEALEVVLCHGWIDAVRRAYDDKHFLQKYTPRGPRSIWSQINKKKVQALLKAKLMRPAGLAAVKRAKENGQWDKAYAPASSFFETLTKNNRYAFLHRLHSAKKEETRAKRLALFIGMLERGETFH